MRKSILNKGDKYGKLTVIRFSYRNKRSRQFWLFKCDCGKEKVIDVQSIKRGDTKSCGCISTGKKTRHGMCRTRTYISWQMMKGRCLNKNYTEYKRYGARGIKVCDRWMKFENFYKDMGKRPKGKTLDRKDNNKGYYKDNCKWSTPKEQSNNQRTNCLLTHKGKTQNITQWAEELDINRGTLYSRLRNGWSVEKVLFK
jgi:hypothetical protein